MNASYVDGYRIKNEFIATQSPLEETIQDFWTMIWEQNCKTIVMLSDKSEKKVVNKFFVFSKKKIIIFACANLEKAVNQLHTISYKAYLIFFSAIYNKLYWNVY